MKTISLKIPASEVSILPELCCGFGLHWAWVFSIMFATARIIEVPPCSENTPIVGFDLMVFCGICTTLLAVGLFGTREAVAIGRKSIAFAAGLAAVSTIIMLGALEYGEGLAVNALVLASGLLAGIASGYLLMSWGFAFHRLDRRSVAINVAGGLLIAVALYGLVLVLDTPIVLAAASLLAAVGEGVLCAAGQPHLPNRDAGKRTPTIASLRGDANGVNVKIILVLVIFGFVDSILRELALSSPGFDENPSGIAVDLILAAASFVVLFSFVHLVLEPRSANKSGYSFATLLVVGASVALLFFMEASSGPIYKLVCIVVYLLFEVHVWTLLAHISHTRLIPPRIVYGLGLFFLFIGQFLSPIANGFVASLANPLQLENVTEPIVLMLALLIVVVLLATGEPLRERPAQESDGSVVVILSKEEDDARRIEAIVRCYLLTDRERETLAMLVKGRSLVKISKTLCVTENTTKTHVKNIYRKTGVHSKQELLDLVESL